MKHTIIALLLLTALVMSNTPVQAGDSSFGISWSATVATGKTNDFVPGFQWRGVNLEYRNRINSNYSWGINAGYNVLSETSSETQFLDHVQVTGKHGRYINTIPIYALAIYEFGPYNRRDGRFYVGMNGGTAWLEHRTELGLYAQQDTNWHLAFAPEIGYHLPWESFLGHISVRYNYLLEAGEVEAQSWLEFRLGFGVN